MMKKIGILCLMSMLLASCGRFGFVPSSTDTTPHAMSQRTLSPAPEAFTSYQIKEYDVIRDANKIVGKVYRPQTEGKVPLVIFSHGLSSTQSSGKSYAAFLASRGVAVYIFDFGGGSTKSKSDGDPQQMSIMTEVADLKAIVEDSQQWDFVNPQKITLLGASQGGVVSALLASQESEAIDGLILLYPAFIIPELVKNTYHSLKEVPENPSYLGALNLGRKYVTDIWGLDIYKEIATYPKKVLILHGSQDRIVPIVYSKRAQETYPDAELFEIIGAGHQFTKQYFDEASDAIWDYLSQNDLTQ